MSTVDAIGGLTAVLATHLDSAIQGFNGARVTTLPPDRAQPGENQSRINLFLSHVATNAAFSNLPMPGTHPGSDGPPPVAITLHYIATFLGKDDLEERGTEAQRMLGATMRLLLDEPELAPDRIRLLAPESHLEHQVDRIRVTTRPLTLEEISRLWPAFQTAYRLSIAVEASCVLIESRDDRPTPLPVIRRGPEDLGPVAVTGSPFPVITSLVVGSPESSFPAARMGDPLLIRGDRLAPPAGRTAVLRVRDANGARIVDVPTTSQPDGSLRAEILPTYPGLPAPVWRAETLTVEVVIREGTEDVLSSSDVVLGLAPLITAIGAVTPSVALSEAGPVVIDAADPDEVTLAVAFAPPVFPDQAVDAWWGTQRLERVTAVGTAPLELLEFRIVRPFGVPVGATSPAAPFRMRVARVDSLPFRLVDPTDPAGGLVMDTATQVEIQWT